MEEDENCRICNRNIGEERVASTLTDKSGGRFLDICPSCRDRLIQERCGVCGNRKVGCSKAWYINMNCSSDDCEGHSVPVCDGCRSVLIDDPVGGITGGFTVGWYSGSHDKDKEKDDFVQEEIEYQYGSDGTPHYNR